MRGHATLKEAVLRNPGFVMVAEQVVCLDCGDHAMLVFVVGLLAKETIITSKQGQWTAVRLAHLAKFAIREFIVVLCRLRQEMS